MGGNGTDEVHILFASLMVDESRRQKLAKFVDGKAPNQKVEYSRLVWGVRVFYIKRNEDQSTFQTV